MTSQQLEYVLVTLGLAAGFALVLIFRSRAARWLLITWLLFLTASLLGLFYFDFQCDGDPFMTGYYNCAGGAEQAKSGNSIGALSLFFMIALIITMPLIAGAAITLEVRKRLNRDDLITNVPLVIGVLILFLLILAPWI